MSNDVSFGGWLKQRRKDIGVTQEELAQHIGCSQFTLQKIENGERRPSGQIAHLLAAYFRVPTDEREAFVTFARTDRAAPLQLELPEAHTTGEGDRRAPWRGTYLHRTNLPAALTPLVGREREEAAARAHLLNPKVRLLTLTGPPGTGKTRLGLQVAYGLVDHFEDGVSFVDLSATIDPDLVLPGLARALGLKDMEGRGIEEILLDYLKKRRMLLFLDNFEQVLDATPQVVKLMHGSPWLKLLVTSREALHVRGEQRFPVPPLGLPDLNRLPTLEALASYPSVELFIERAQAVAPDFALTEENSEAVASVCVGLEGLPLAIELAAARANYLSPWEMKTVLSSRLRLLTGGGRDLPPRQRTLASAIEWSYDLLDTDEQALFRRLSVFVGGFTPSAVETICAAGTSPDPRSLTPDPRSLTPDPRPLVNKSLVKAETAAAQGREVRFGMLEAIREYAREKLHSQSQEEDAVKSRHALYFMELAEEAEPHLAGPEQVKWLDRLEREHDNLRAALSWAREHSKSAEAVETGLRAASALCRFWYKRGYINEGREQLSSVLAFVETLSSSPSWLSLQPHITKTLDRAGILAHLQGDYTSARHRYEEALAIRRQIDDRPGMAFSMNQLGMLIHEQGDNAYARSLYEQSLALYRELGDKEGAATSLNSLAILNYEQGDFASARPMYEECLSIRRELGDKRGIAHLLSALGLLSQTEGDSASARALYEESLSIWREFGDPIGIAHALDQLGGVACDQGDYATARALYEESLSIFWKAGSKIHVLNSLVGLGHLAAIADGAFRGARLLGATGALWEAMSITPGRDARRQYEEGIASAQAHLNETAFAAARSEGQSMPIEEAVAYALSDT